MGSKKTKTCNLPEPGDTNDNVDMESEEGYGVIFDTCYPMILKYVNARVKSVEDAEDITDGVFLKGWEKRSSYRGTGSPMAWLGKIAYNTTNEYWRQEKRIERESYEDLETQGNQRIRTYIRNGVLPPDEELETAETQRLVSFSVAFHELCCYYSRNLLKGGRYVKSTRTTECNCDHY